MNADSPFHRSDRGVSPVIGVVMMVAITVILAAVVGTYVVGLGDSLTETAPQASFTVESATGDTVTIVKTGGDPLDTTQLALSIGGDRVDAGFSGDEWRTGDTERVTHDTDATGEQTLRLIHDPSGSIVYETTVDVSE
jgi:flagellin-like protein